MGAKYCVAEMSLSFAVRKTFASRAQRYWRGEWRRDRRRGRVRRKSWELRIKHSSPIMIISLKTGSLLAFETVMCLYTR